MPYVYPVESASQTPIRVFNWGSNPINHLNDLNHLNESIYPIKFFEEKECNEFNRGHLTTKLFNHLTNKTN